MSISRLMDRPIAFQRTYVRLGVGVTGALMLSQAVYWSTRAGSGGWFYKDRDEWEEETGLTRREQETARKRLKQAGFLLEDRRGLPCRLYFKVDHDALDEALMALGDDVPTSRADCAQQAGANQPNSEVGKRPSSTETTTETTAEITPSSPDGDLLGGEREADAVGELEEAFAIFWAAGMVKTGKKAARSRFLKLAKEKADPLAFAKSLADDIRERLAACQLGFDKMHPTTYLNGERWEDDIVPGRDTRRAARPMHNLNSLDHEGDPMMAGDGRIAPEPRRTRG